jgi:hypothetical protein
VRVEVSRGSLAAVWKPPGHQCITGWWFNIKNNVELGSKQHGEHS